MGKRRASLGACIGGLLCWRTGWLGGTRAAQDHADERRPAAFTNRAPPQSGRTDWTCTRPGRSCPFRSEEHTSELQSLMRKSYADFCLKKKTNKNNYHHPQQTP